MAGTFLQCCHGSLELGRRGRVGRSSSGSSICWGFFLFFPPSFLGSSGAFEGRDDGSCLGVFPFLNTDDFWCAKVLFPIY